VVLILDDAHKLELPRLARPKGKSESVFGKIAGIWIVSKSILSQKVTGSGNVMSRRRSSASTLIGFKRSAGVFVATLVKGAA